MKRLDFFIYCAMMNILDGIALNETEITDDEKDKLCDVLNTLAEFQSGESLEDVINTIGDANDCGCVATWDDLIDRLIELFNNGERIPL